MQATPTPSLIIDLPTVKRNIARLAGYSREHNIAIRPHTKTHKSIRMAKLQLDAGAKGLTVAKVGEAITMAQASDDIKATTGIFDASLGAQGNETSGIAIRQRQSQAGLANAHFIDNLNRAIRQCGIILCDLIPKIYDAADMLDLPWDGPESDPVRVGRALGPWLAVEPEPRPAWLDPRETWPPPA